VNLPLFIAKKIYGDKGEKQKVSRPAISIATAGVAIGLAVMLISVSVVLGFKHTIRDKVIGFGSNILMRGRNSNTTYFQHSISRPGCGNYICGFFRNKQKILWNKVGYPRHCTK